MCITQIETEANPVFSCETIGTMNTLDAAARSAEKAAPQRRTR